MAEAVLTLQYGSKTFGSVQEGMNQVVADLRKSWDGSVREASVALRAYLTEVAQELANRHSKPWPGGTSDNSLSSRSGEGVRSILRSVKVRGTTWETLSGEIGGRDYLGIHEYGGTMIGKGGKMLTIPLPAALNSKGVAPPFARQFRDTFVGRSKKGNLLIFQRRGAEIVPLYILVDKVTIRPRLGMRKELEAQIPYFIEQATDRVVNEIMRQIGD